MTELPPSSLRVAEAARRLNLEIAIRVMPSSTRTAEEAAAACGCAVGQIVKSLVFRGASSGRPLLLLVSGANRVDERIAAAAVGEAFSRPDAAFVREATGFSIGGIPPFGHVAPLATFMDRDLLALPVVWAAAGTPAAVFSTDPARLQEAIGATVIQVR